MFSIGILLFDGVEIASFATPYRVFSAAQRLHAATGARRRLLRCFLVAERLQPVRIDGGMKVLPDCVLFPAAELDVLIVPGGDTAPVQGNRALINWIRMQAGGAIASLGIAEGACILAATDLDQDASSRYKPAPPGWSPAPSRHAKVRSLENAKVFTTDADGAAASSLQLVAQLGGRALARLTAQHLQLEWKPHDEDSFDEAADSGVFSAA